MNPSRLILRHPRTGACLVFALAALLQHWPLLSAPFSQTYGRAPWDDYLLIWVLDWVQHALLVEPHNLFHPPIFFPWNWGLSTTDAMLGLAIPLLPLRLLGLGPIALYNAAYLLGSFLNGIAAFACARALLPATSPLEPEQAMRAFAAALLAGLVFMLYPFRLYEIDQVRLYWTAWLPLGTLALIRFARDPRRRWAILGAFAWLWGWLCSAYLGLYASLALAVALLLLLGGPDQRGPRLRILSVPFGVSTSLIVVLHLPYLIGAQRYGFTRYPYEELSFALEHLIRPNAESLLGGLLRGATISGSWIGFGLLMLLLPALWLQRHRILPDRGWPFGWREPGTGLAAPRRIHAAHALALLALTGIVLSLGSVLMVRDGRVSGIPLPWRLLAALPGFGETRSPFRMIHLTHFALAMLAAPAAWTLLNRRSRLATGLVGLAAIAIVFEGLPQPQPLLAPATTMAELQPEYGPALRGNREDLIERPPYPRENPLLRYAHAQYDQTIHHHPLVFGYSGYVLPYTAYTMKHDWLVLRGMLPADSEPWPLSRLTHFVPPEGANPIAIDAPAPLRSNPPGWRLRLPRLFAYMFPEYLPEDAANLMSPEAGVEFELSIEEPLLVATSTPFGSDRWPWNLRVESRGPDGGWRTCDGLIAAKEHAPALPQLPLDTDRPIVWPWVCPPATQALRFSGRDYPVWGWDKLEVWALPPTSTAGD